MRELQTPVNHPAPVGRQLSREVGISCRWFPNCNRFRNWCVSACRANRVGGVIDTQLGPHHVSSNYPLRIHGWRRGYDGKGASDGLCAGLVDEPHRLELRVFRNGRGSWSSRHCPEVSRRSKGCATKRAGRPCRKGYANERGKRRLLQSPHGAHHSAISARRSCSAS